MTARLRATAVALGCVMLSGCSARAPAPSPPPPETRPQWGEVIIEYNPDAPIPQWAKVPERALYECVRDGKDVTCGVYVERGGDVGFLTQQDPPAAAWAAESMKSPGLFASEPLVPRHRYAWRARLRP
jgi:hypothetical protein